MILDSLNVSRKWNLILFCCTDSEMELKKRFEGVYRSSNTSTMQSIDRQVFGCDFGGNSWTDREQAEALLEKLALGGSSKLIDLGAGTGWPGLYLAKQSGCHVTLVDLPEIGLQIATQRAKMEGIEDRVTTLVADAADLPFPNGSFDAISHSDLLCCLVRKRTVLEQCHRILGMDGRMAFTVISVSSDLSPSAHAKALANAPKFVETESSYHALLEETGWDVIERIDLTGEYCESCARLIDADCDFHTELAELLGVEEANARLVSGRSNLKAIEDGLFLRELFVCEVQN
jgi:ubiquinone/menaquinone biosynthesis C-methylase UbiE